MIVKYYDGSTLTCSKVWVYEDKFICDDIWEIPIVEVNGIVDDSEELEVNND